MLTNAIHYGGAVVGHNFVAGAPSSATVTISATESDDKVFPAGVWFTTTVTGFDVGGPSGGLIYNPSFHKITYVWSFSDVGTYNSPINLIAAHNDKNVAYGPKVSHVFDADGVFLVTCTATDRSGTVAVDTFNVTIADGAVVYATTNTICVALDNIFTGAPTGSDNYNTLAGGLAAYAALGTNGRILLKRGETHTQTSAITVANDNYPNFHLGAWGSGARPVLDITGTINTNNLWIKPTNAKFDFTATGIHFQGGWNEETESGDTGQWGINCDEDVHGVIHDCTFSGHNIAIYVNDDAIGYLFINDIDVTNWGGGIAVFGGNAQSATVGLTGSALHRSVDAYGGGYPRGGAEKNHHGPFRHSFKNLYFGCNDLNSNAGHNGSTGGTQFFHQPCIRHNTIVNDDVFAYYERFACEGGLRVINLVDSEGIDDDIPGNVILDMFTLIATAAANTIIRVWYSGTTIRNFVISVPNTPAFNGAGTMAEFIQFGGDGNNAENTNGNVDIYNGTFNFDRDVTNHGTGSIAILSASPGAVFPNYTMTNCVLNAPNLQTPIVDEANLSQTSLFTPRFKGQRNNYTPAGVLDRKYATPTHTLDFDAETVGFGVDDTLTGGTSGATAHIVAVETNGTVGKLWLANVSGTFQNNETITDGGSGSATSDGVVAAATALEFALTGTSAASGAEIAFNDFYGDERGVSPDIGHVQFT